MALVAGAGGGALDDRCSGGRRPVHGKGGEGGSTKRGRRRGSTAARHDDNGEDAASSNDHSTNACGGARGRQDRCGVGRPERERSHSTRSVPAAMPCSRLTRRSVRPVPPRYVRVAWQKLRVPNRSSGARAGCEGGEKGGQAPGAGVRVGDSLPERLCACAPLGIDWQARLTGSQTRCEGATKKQELAALHRPPHATPPLAAAGTACLGRRAVRCTPRPAQRRHGTSDPWGGPPGLAPLCGPRWRCRASSGAQEKVRRSGRGQPCRWGGLGTAARQLKVPKSRP